jgi:hypothetical protein
VITIASIERIFQRQRWQYEMSNGRVVTSFEGIPMMLGVETGGQAVIILVPLYVPGGASARASKAHEQDVDSFLGAVNRDLTLGSYIRDGGSIYYMLGLAMDDGQLSDEELAGAIAYVVGVVKSFGPIVKAIAEGQVSLEDALDALRRAVTNARRQRVA